jgi:preprotein translocase subunit SecA
MDRELIFPELPMPGVVFGAYPERRNGSDGAHSHWIENLAGQVRRMCRRAKGHSRFVQEVRALAPALAAMPLDTLISHARNVSAAAKREGLAEPWVARAFATVIDACRRTHGVSPYDTQIIAARIMLEGALAEMATGEGKTYAIALGAATAALAGIPVHVITANDYLVERDAQHLAPLYQALGLSVGAITQKLDAGGRRRAYRCDVTYCTGKDLVFDYLRDGLQRAHAKEPLRWRLRCLGASEPLTDTLLRGLCMAIVDEADSVLLDDASVPLILAAPTNETVAPTHFRHALELARGLRPGVDFTLHRETFAAVLTAAGRAVLGKHAPRAAIPLSNTRAHEEAIELALAALHLYRRDRHYAVRDGRIEIIDENTGRLALGRAFSRGLHQLIEINEGCGNTTTTTTTAQITFQQFFRRYFRVAGMSGTLCEARSELASVYRLAVEAVPLRRPSRRRVGRLRMFCTREQQWRAVVGRASSMVSSGRATLIGTDSIEESHSLSRFLNAAGLPHQVLNALNDESEARIIAGAGAPGCITVATNMAGRGTDIALAAGVAERGGLHVISCQLNSSRRIDRQLLGRCARQGDPGSAEVILSLETALLQRVASPSLLRTIARMGKRDTGVVPEVIARALAWAVQRIAEHRGRALRRQLLEQDKRWREQALLAALVE